MFIGYAGNVIQDTLVPYGGFDTNASTTDAGNGFVRGLLETGPAALALPPRLATDTI